jgi:hypothetical protein
LGLGEIRGELHVAVSLLEWALRSIAVIRTEEMRDLPLGSAYRIYEPFLHSQQGERQVWSLVVGYHVTVDAAPILQIAQLEAVGWAIPWVMAMGKHI